MRNFKYLKKKARRFESPIIDFLRVKKRLIALFSANQIHLFPPVIPSLG